jgi:hypothetical protein
MSDYVFNDLAEWLGIPEAQCRETMTAEQAANCLAVLRGLNRFGRCTEEEEKRLRENHYYDLPTVRAEQKDGVK